MRWSIALESLCCSHEGLVALVISKLEIPFKVDDSNNVLRSILICTWAVVAE